MVAVVANNVQCTVGGNNGVFEWFLMYQSVPLGKKANIESKKSDMQSMHHR
jgi:hypothetical protein